MTKDGAWPRDEVDRFILARLETAGLRPSVEVDRVTWLRRVSLDLTGLPPSPEEVAAAYDLDVEKQAQQLGLPGW